MKNTDKIIIALLSVLILMIGALLLKDKLFPKSYEQEDFALHIPKIQNSEEQAGEIITKLEEGEKNLITANDEDATGIKMEFETLTNPSFADGANQEESPKSDEAPQSVAEIADSNSNETPQIPPETFNSEEQAGEIITKLEESEKIAKEAEKTENSDKAKEKNNELDETLTPPQDADIIASESNDETKLQEDEKPEEISPNKPAKKLQSKQSAKKLKNKSNAKKKNSMTREEKSALVTIEGSNGVGTGFFAKIDDKYFIVSNIHVLCEIKNAKAKTLTGEVISIGKLYVALENHDVAIVPIKEIPNSCTYLEFEQNIVENVKEDDEVIICGNSAGGGTMLETHGQVIGIGPNLIETDCPVFPGNSGSPIFHVERKKVIGVLSYIMKVDTSSEFVSGTMQRAGSALKTTLRYFGYRFDTIQKWQGITQKEAYSQVEFLNEKLRKLIFISRYCGNVGPGLPIEYGDFKEAWIKLQKERTERSIKEYHSKVFTVIKNEKSTVTAKSVSSIFESRKKHLLRLYDHLETAMSTIIKMM